MREWGGGKRANSMSQQSTMREWGGPVSMRPCIRQAHSTAAIYRGGTGEGEVLISP